MERTTLFSLSGPNTTTVSDSSLGNNAATGGDNNSGTAGVAGLVGCRPRLLQQIDTYHSLAWDGLALGAAQIPLAGVPASFETFLRGILSFRFLPVVSRQGRVRR